MTENLLRLQEFHVSKSILCEEDESMNRVLSVRHNYLRGHPPHPRIIQCLEEADFYLVYQVGSFNIDQHLITAFVKRWRPETHTFHLPYGECTITLEDVEIQLGLNVDGEVVTGESYTKVELDNMCEALLGVIPPPSGKAKAISLPWLATHFSQLPEDAPQQVVEIYARAYILRIIGGVLMPDTSSHRVHLKYLSLLHDLSQVGKYSWGSATLAVLYRELCKASLKNQEGNFCSQIGGCMILLQAWIWDHIPHLAPRIQRVSNIEGLRSGNPLARRWRRKKNTTDIPSHSISYYRLCLDHLNMYQFVWQPYQQILEMRGISTSSTLYWAVIPLICFSIVEVHQADRVMRQIGLIQNIPDPPINLDDLHKVNMRKVHNVSWEDHHRQYIQYWNGRNSVPCPSQSYIGDGCLSDNSVYMQWYSKNTIRWLCPRFVDRPMEVLAQNILELTKKRDPETLDEIANVCIQVVAESLQNRSKKPPPIDAARQRRLLQIDNPISQEIQDIPPYYHHGFSNDPSMSQIGGNILFPMYGSTFHPQSHNTSFSAHPLTLTDSSEQDHQAED